MERFRKKLLFIGRSDPDTGLPVARQLAHQMGWDLVELTGQVSDPRPYISRADYIFVSGYLTILEAAKNKKIIIAYYSNPLRLDYLKMHPIADCMIIGQTSAQIENQLHHHSPAQIAKMKSKSFVWARRQTWARLASIYEKLWNN